MWVFYLCAFANASTIILCSCNAWMHLQSRSPHWAGVNLCGAALGAVGFASCLNIILE